MAKVVDVSCAFSRNEELGTDTGPPLVDFATCDSIKDKVKVAKNTDKKPYDVQDFYYKEGKFQEIAKNPIFENVTLGVIVINALWISIDTDWNQADTLLDAHPVFVAFDSMFFAYFSVELFIRFMAFERKFSCFKDAWFVFDSTLVALYFFDPFIISIMAAASGGEGLNLPTSILRLFRLARLSRLVRMLRSLPELMIMIKGMVQAAASVGYTMGLLMVICYVFAIALTQLAAEKEGIREAYFSSVPTSIYSLLIYATLLDGLADFCHAVRAESTPCLILVVLFVVLGSLTVMNMLIGVLCEVISETAVVEKDSMITDKVYERFGDIVETLDGDKNQKISWTEFQYIMGMPTAIRELESVDVDPIGMIDLAEDFFFDEGIPRELTFEEFMEMILDMRGHQQATLKHIMLLGKRFNKKSANVKSIILGIESKIDKAIDKYEKLLSAKGL